MKKNGFVLMETIVVIVVVTVALLSIFVSYNKILSKVRSENKYDTSEYIYVTKWVRDYLKTQDITAKNISNVTDYAEDNTYLSDRIKELYGITHVYILTGLVPSDDSPSNKNSIFSGNETKVDPYMIDYIRKLDVRYNDKLIIVEYKRPVRKKDYIQKTDSENKPLYETYIASLEW